MPLYPQLRALVEGKGHAPDDEKRVGSWIHYFIPKVPSARSSLFFKVVKDNANYFKVVIRNISKNPVDFLADNLQTAAGAAASGKKFMNNLIRHITFTATHTDQGYDDAIVVRARMADCLSCRMKIRVPKSSLDEDDDGEVSEYSWLRERVRLSQDKPWTSSTP